MQVISKRKVPSNTKYDYGYFKFINNNLVGFAFGNSFEHLSESTFIHAKSISLSTYHKPISSFTDLLSLTNHYQFYTSDDYPELFI